MKPKEKALELYRKFMNHSHLWDCRNDEPTIEDHTGKCVLIHIDEMINNLKIRYPTQSLNSVKHDLQFQAIRDFINENVEDLEKIKKEVIKISNNYNK